MKKETESSVRKLFDSLDRTLGLENSLIGLDIDVIIEELNLDDVGRIRPSDPTGSRLIEYAKVHGNPWKGKHHTEEFKKQQSLRISNFFSTERGKETKKKLAEHAKRNNSIKNLESSKHLSKDTFWWNNGIITKRSKICPGENYILGRIPWKK